MRRPKYGDFRLVPLLFSVCCASALAQLPPPVSFQAMVNYPVGPSPTSVAVADFNGDGIVDLAVANGGGANVSVLLGKSDGTFTYFVPDVATRPGTAGRLLTGSRCSGCARDLT